MVIGGIQLEYIPKGLIDTLKLKINATTANQTWKDSVTSSIPVKYVTVWYDQNLKLGMTNVWTNMALRNLTGSQYSSIEMILESAKLLDTSSNTLQSIQDGISTIYSAIYLIFAFAFAVFGIAIFIQYENMTGR